MSSTKHFVANGFTNNPQRYGNDSGDLNLINDYFELQGWDPLSREQHTAIAAIIRNRNYFLQENEAYDHRTKNKTSMFRQLSIYDFLDNDTAVQARKITRYIDGNENRLSQSNSRIKKSVRGVDNEHISAVKVMYSLFHSNPKLKKMRIIGDKRKAPAQRALSDSFDSLEETNFYDGVAGE